MAAKTLHLGPGVDLPLDAATESVGILGQRGSGKSNVAVVFAEEEWKAGIPWVAIDPKGDWYGIRSSADGKGPGLPIPVFGGLHGDVPLEPSSGLYVADLLVDQMLTAVLDISRFSVGEMSTFLIAFCHRLFDRHQADPHVRTVIFEEAHRYIAQAVTSATAALKEAAAKIPLEGRAFGLGSLAPSQRSSRLHKDVLTQFSIMIAMRSPAKLDRDAIGGWVEEHGVAKELLGSLPGLDNGEGWLWSPHYLHRADRVRFRRRETFDSGATPKVGQAIRAPRTIADVDLAAINKAMAATIEKAKADDPAALRKQIRDLERQLKERPVEKVPEPAEPEIVEVPVLDDDLAAELRAQFAAVRDLLEDRRALIEAIGRFAALPPPAAAKPAAAPIHTPAQPVRTTPAPAPKPGRPERGRNTEGAQVAAGGELAGPQRRVLDAIAWLVDLGFPQPTKVQVGFIAGYRTGKKVGGAYGNILGGLRSAGLIDYPTPGSVVLTAEGASVASPSDIEPTTDGLQSAVFARLSEPEQRVLRPLIEVYPEALSKQDVGAAAGYTVGDKVGGAFGNILGRLRSLGLIDYPAQGTAAATSILFLEGAR
jgi:uncharacterized protein